MNALKRLLPNEHVTLRAMITLINHRSFCLWMCDNKDSCTELWYECYDDVNEAIEIEIDKLKAKYVMTGNASTKSTGDENVITEPVACKVEEEEEDDGTWTKVMRRHRKNK